MRKPQREIDGRLFFKLSLLLVSYFHGGGGGGILHEEHFYRLFLLSQP
jgi:hypothetical protein